MKVIEEDNTALITRLKKDAMVRRVAMYDAGEFVDAGKLCERLGISRHELRKAVREKRMFSVEGKKKERWYPSLFFDSPAGRCRLEQVSVALGDLQGDAKLHFFKTPRYSLDESTPLAALEAGALERVIRLADEYRMRVKGR